MKICIPTVDDRGLEAQASDHFGGAPYFTVVDMEDDAVRVIPNPECHDNPGACHHLSTLAAHGIEAVVCRGMGRNALAGLKAAGVDVLAPAEGPVSEILSAVRAGNVRPLDPRTACGGGHHGHGHGRGGGCHGHGRGGGHQGQG